MKHSFDSYGFYKVSLFSKYVIRAKLRMKDTVDIKVLRKAVNTATRRYPYFMVQLHIDKEGSFVLTPNDSDIAVIDTSRKRPDLCTKEVGYHLLFVECEGSTIYFNISHALAGGKGMTPWVMTCIYQYVVEKYGVIPSAPAIRKPGSALLDGEDAQPTLEMTRGSKRFDNRRFKGGKLLFLDYVNSVANPFVSSHEYFEFEFDQKDIVGYAKSTNNSVLTFFEVLMFRAMSKVFPKARKIVGECAHNPSAALGIPNTYTNVLSHVLFLFTRDMLNWDMKEIGTVTRDSLRQQIDPVFSRYELGQYMMSMGELDKVIGHKEKQKYIKKRGHSIGGAAVHGTFIVNYAGYMDWGEVADYIDSYFVIADGHQMLELSALGDKIFCCYLQVVRTDKYVDAFKQVLEELDIPYTIRGPYKKNMMKHRIAD